MADFAETGPAVVVAAVAAGRLDWPAAAAAVAWTPVVVPVAVV